MIDHQSFFVHHSSLTKIDLIISLFILDSSVIFGSGGDDNSIFTSKFQLQMDQGKLCCHVIWTDQNVYSHHSTITGNYIFSHCTFLQTVFELKVYHLSSQPTR